MQEMGFSEAAVRRALILNRNRAEESVNWLLSHSDDDNFEEVPSEEEIR